MSKLPLKSFRLANIACLPNKKWKKDTLPHYSTIKIMCALAVPKENTRHHLHPPVSFCLDFSSQGSRVNSAEEKYFLPQYKTKRSNFTFNRNWV